MDSPGKNTRVGCLGLLQGGCLVLLQGWSSWSRDQTCISCWLLNCKQILYCWVTGGALAYPFEVKCSESLSVLYDSAAPCTNTVHGILQARILEWAAFPFTRGWIFPTQGSNPGLLHCKRILYQLSHKGSPRILEWIAYPFSSEFSWPRNWTRVSCIAGGFFTNWAYHFSFL